MTTDEASNTAGPQGSLGGFPLPGFAASVVAVPAPGEWHGVVLEGRPGAWDARGARVTTVLPDGRAAYDGRATAEENFFERTGLAYQSEEPGRLRHVDSEPVDVRYLDLLPLREGGFRLYYEARLPDESHELRTELVPPQTGPTPTKK